MSTIRATKAYQAQPKTDVSGNMQSAHHVDESHETYSLDASSKNGLSRASEEDPSVHEKIESDVTPQATSNEDHLEKLLSSSDKNVQKKLTGDHAEQKKTIKLDLETSRASFHQSLHDKMKSNKIESHADSDEDDNDVKEKAPTPKPGIGMGMPSATAVAKNEQPEISDLMSAAASAMSALLNAPPAPLEDAGSASPPSLSDVTDDGSIEESPEEKLHLEGARGGSSSMMKTGGTFKTEGVVGAPVALGEAFPKAVASGMRTTRFADFLTELTSTVSQARFNSTSGQDITLQLRSDVLEGTQVHVNANTAEMKVSFVTTSAESNLLLNSHLTTLQNHLAVLCPGQSVEVKNQFLSSSTLLDAQNEGENSQEDLASFQQGNRGNLRDNDDSL